MKFAFKRSLSPVAYCAIHIKTGTRYEDAGKGGLAHVTEHLLFKGTETRSANTVNSYIEKLGGELNAYTTKEETVIHATVLKEDLRRAVDLLMDIAFRCTFPEKEIEKERGVVLEEINTYKDSPSEQIYDDFEELMFEGTPLSMPVLGKAKYLRKADRSIVEGYYRAMFRQDRMYFTAVADMEEKKAEEKAGAARLRLSSQHRPARDAVLIHYPEPFARRIVFVEREPLTVSHEIGRRRRRILARNSVTKISHGFAYRSNKIIPAFFVIIDAHPLRFGQQLFQHSVSFVI